MNKAFTVNGRTIDELLAFHRVHFGDARMEEPPKVTDPPEEPAGGFKPPASQDELNKIIADRVNREKAKFADYSDLKTKAAKLDEIEQATKTEAEKSAERFAKLEAENAAIKASALRSRIQAKYSVSDEDAELFLTGADEVSLTKQAERLAERDTERKKQGNRVPREGTSSKPGEDPMREFARELFKSGE